MTIGGIYAGVFTPVEASAVGAALVIILAIAQGHRLEQLRQVPQYSVLLRSQSAKRAHCEHPRSFG